MLGTLGGRGHSGNVEIEIEERSENSVRKKRIISICFTFDSFELV